jgi:hypothetical protein
METIICRLFLIRWPSSCSNSRVTLLDRNHPSRT